MTTSWAPSSVLWQHTKVGHTIGLRHNFGATTPASGKTTRQKIHGGQRASSIMDYARFNYMAQPEQHH
ncbi:MAG: zinc-dependent metalloprotease [Lewinellaceae bacterium]|nr:zinc-dependent metalloprotease [Lewinellaceae bacterium]